MKQISFLPLKIIPAHLFPLNYFDYYYPNLYPHVSGFSIWGPNIHVQSSSMELWIDSNLNILSILSAQLHIRNFRELKSCMNLHRHHYMTVISQKTCSKYMTSTWRLIYKSPAQVGEGRDWSWPRTRVAPWLSANKEACFGEEMGMSSHLCLWRPE